MTRTAVRATLGLAAWSAFFWGVAGAIDLGLLRSRKGYTFPEGGGWYTLALLAGLIVGWFAVASLTDLVSRRSMAAIPAVGAAIGAVACMLHGWQTRHWVGALVLALIGALLPLAAHLRELAAANAQARSRRP